MTWGFKKISPEEMKTLKWYQSTGIYCLRIKEEFLVLEHDIYSLNNTKILEEKF